MLTTPFPRLAKNFLLSRGRWSRLTVQRDKILSRGSTSIPFWIGYQIAEELISSCSVNGRIQTRLLKGGALDCRFVVSERWGKKDPPVPGFVPARYAHHAHLTCSPIIGEYGMSGRGGIKPRVTTFRGDQIKFSMLDGHTK
jgi:hypothetical protein